MSPTALKAASQQASFELLFNEIRACRLCQAHLPPEPRPLVQASSTSCLLIVSQAPGRKAYETDIPFNEASGDRLRDWLGMDRTTFHHASKIAIAPMGFCFPGTGKGGDLPPRPECATTWHPRAFPLLTQIKLTLAISRYALAGLLGDRRGRTLADTMPARRGHLARGILPLTQPLPYPSPRNRMWLTRNPWFKSDLRPVLRERVAIALADGA